MKLVLTLFFALFAGFSFCQQPTGQEIEQVVYNFLSQKSQSIGTRYILKNAAVQQVKTIRPVKQSEKIQFYIAELQPSGFMVISNHKSLEPVLAYSEKGTFGVQSDTSVFYRFLVQEMGERLKNISQGTDKWAPVLQSLKSTADDFRQWPEAGTTATGGWVETTWHQGHPYNSEFPLIPNTNRRVVTGCVSTALSQILNYHQYLGEAQLNSSFSYISKRNSHIIQIDGDYGVLDFPSFYELNNTLTSIKNKYSSHTTLTDREKSALMFFAAITVKSDFSSSTSANAGLIPDVLKEVYNYESCDISYHLNPTVYSALVNNMKLAKPALLSIQKSENEGHLIVCDGYNTAGYFHLNFGWGEDSPEQINDVWYNIPYEFPDNYTLLNSVIYNIQPLQKDIYASVSRIDLYPDPQLATSSFFIFSQGITASVDLKCHQFLLSADSVNFSGELTGVQINAETGKKIWIKYTPADSTQTGYVEIKQAGELVEAIDVTGYSSGNILFPGSVSGTWNSKAPYVITGDIFVDSMNTLLIEKGVTLSFYNGATLSVLNGTLKVKGTAEEPVTFTSFKEEEKWGGLLLNDSGDNDTLQHTVVMNSENSGIRVVNTNPLFENCFICNNTALTAGGGISLVQSKARIKGSIIVNNSSGWQYENYGGGIYMENSEAEIINTTISRNRAVIGGGIFADNTVVNLVNSILWENSSSTYLNNNKLILHNEIALNYTNTSVSANSTIIKDLETSNKYGKPCGLYDFIKKENIISRNPNFINGSKVYGPVFNALNYNWRIARTSFAVNNGSNSAVKNLPSTDFYGNARVKFNNIDIGAAECIDSSSYLTVNPVSFLDFPVTAADTFTVKKLLIKNNGEEEITISLNIDKKVYFSVEEYYENKILASGDSLYLDVKYTPQTNNVVDTGYLILYTNSRNYVYEKIRLTGTACSGKLIHGAVSGVWEKKYNPYLIDGDTWVKENDGLRIEKGVQVFVTGNYKFSVKENSELHIRGTEQDSVEFYGLKYWKGFEFVNTEKTSTVDFLKINNVKNSMACDVRDADILITNSSFIDSENCIFLTGNQDKGKVWDIRNNKFSGNIMDIIHVSSGFESNPDKQDTLFVIGNHIQNNLILNNIITESNSLLFFKIDSNFISGNTMYENNIEHNNTSGKLGTGHNSISYNIICNNTGIKGFGIESRNENTVINNNLIVNNLAQNSYQSNILYASGNQCEILNNTVAFNDNKAQAMYMSYYSAGYPANNYGDNFKVLNNIFYNNTNNTFFPAYETSYLQVEYNVCDESSTDENGNYYFNPLFQNPPDSCSTENRFNLSDWYLKNSSPCIDAGNPEAKYFDKPDRNNPGNALFPAQKSLINDLGAFGGNNNSSFSREEVTICDGDNYLGLINEGKYYRLLESQNGRDSIVSTDLQVIYSEISWNNPFPAEHSVVPGGDIHFSWDSGNSSDSLQFAAYFSIDNKNWKPFYRGSETDFTSTFERYKYSGETIYWYLVYDNGHCIWQSPVWEFSIEIITQTDAKEKGIPDFTIIPNPNNGKFTFSLNSSAEDEIRLTLTNALGQSVEKRIITSSVSRREIFDVGDLRKGLYFLIISTDKNQITEKIVIQ